MAKPDEQSKSDDLEIICVGSLYTGPWDKKYWSSSRGKDRYPYPVGYKALRTHKGLTYKMEIHEGSKGPMFQITSNNKQAGSGDTPDRAWENFQKKYCSHVKLWHGKRFSGKVDGVEFFGFKNALVQRLLRELVATVNDASDQSSLCNNFNEVSANNPGSGYTMSDKCPDLMPYLKKNKATGKRSRLSKGTEKKSACKGNSGRCQLQQEDDDAKVFHSTSCKNVDELMVSCGSGEDNDITHASGPLPVSLDMEVVKDVSLSAHAFEAHDDSKEPCVEGKRELPSTETCTSASLVNFNSSQEDKLLARQCVDVQGHGHPVTEEKNERAQVLNDSLDLKHQVLNDSQAGHCIGLFAPDTLDTQQEVTFFPDLGSRKQENFIGGNNPAAVATTISEEPINESHSEEGNFYLNGNSERSDFYSVGDEITKSMMTLLLPQAVPLLTYSSRKKRRTEPSKGSSIGKKQENKLEGTGPSADVTSPVKALADSSSEGLAGPHVSGACIDSAIPPRENVRLVVPDSLDDYYEDFEANQPLSSADNAEAVATDAQKVKHETDRDASSVAVDASKTFCCSQTDEVKDSVDDQMEDHVANQVLSSFAKAEAVTSDSQKEKPEAGQEASAVAVDVSEKFCCNQTDEVKDSMDDQIEDLVANQVLSSFAKVEAVTSDYQKEKPEAGQEASAVAVDASEKFCCNQTNKVNESLDDHFEDHVANRVLSSADNAEVVMNDPQKGNHKDGREASSASVHANEKFCCNQTNEVKESLFHEEPEKEVIQGPQKHCVPALHPSIGCVSSIMLNRDTPSKDDCCDGFKLVDTHLEEGHTCEGLVCIPQPPKQQSLHFDAPQDPSLSVPVIGKYTGSLSESIICRNASNTDLSETFPAAGNMVAADSIQFTPLDLGHRTETSFDVESSCGGQLPLLCTKDNHVSGDQALSCAFDKNDTEFIGGNNGNSGLHVDPGTIVKQHCGSVDHSADQKNALAPDSSYGVPDDEALGCSFNKNGTEFIGGNLDVGNSEPCIDASTSGKQHCGSVDHAADQARDLSANAVSHVSKDQDVIQENIVSEQKHDDTIGSEWKLIGCYAHPEQVSSVILTRKGHEIYVCVSCGIPEEKERNLFMYKIDAEERPHMVACTSMCLSLLKDEFGREVAVDKTGLQFTPDGTGLVMVDSIKTPYCMEKNIHCLCPQCKSSCFEENAIKIVQVKLGYVSVVLKLKTGHPLHCILVCEPEYLVALDESGMIYIWVMNPSWSVQLEEYVIPSYEFLPSRVVELKKIPRSASMVLGHNGYGQFSLWDITKRTVVSEFSAPLNSVLEFVPVSLFCWQRKSLRHGKLVKEECMKKLMEAAMLGLSGHPEVNMSCEMEGKDLAVLLFISSPSDSRVQSSNCRDDPKECWKLGLLIKNRLIIGSAVSPSTTAIGTAAGHGIIGSDKGHVCIWDLVKATKLRSLHDFEGSRVSQIVADDATSSAVAITSDSELLVYLLS